MRRKYLKFRRNGTFILFVTSVFIFFIFAFAFPEYFKRVQEITGIFWQALIVLLTFLGLVAGGVIKNPPKSFARFLDNTFVQIAVVEIFIVVTISTILAFWAFTLYTNQE